MLLLLLQAVVDVLHRTSNMNKATTAAAFHHPPSSAPLSPLAPSCHRRSRQGRYCPGDSVPLT